MCSAARRGNAPHIEQLPSSLKPESYSREAGKASFNTSLTYVRKSGEAETQTVESRKPPKGGYVFRDILLRRLENRRSHKRGGNLINIFPIPSSYYNHGSAIVDIALKE